MLFTASFLRSSFWRRQDIRWRRWGCRLGMRADSQALDADESTRSEIIISDISISLDFVACRVSENIHPWAKGQEGGEIHFFRWGKRINRCPTGECVDDCNEHVMYGLCRLYWLGGWCPTGPLHVSLAASTLIRGVEDGHEDGLNTTSRCLGTFQLTS